MNFQPIHIDYYSSLYWRNRRPINFKTHFQNRRHEHLPFKDEWLASFLEDHCTILISWRKTFSMSNKELTNSKAKFCFEHVYGSTNSEIYIFLQLFPIFLYIEVISCPLWYIFPYPYCFSKDSLYIFNCNVKALS